MKIFCKECDGEGTAFCKGHCDNCGHACGCMKEIKCDACQGTGEVDK